MTLSWFAFTKITCFGCAASFAGGRYKWTFVLLATMRRKPARMGEERLRQKRERLLSDDVSLAKLERDVFHSIQLFSR